MQEKDPFFARQIRPGLRSGLFGSSGHGIIKQAAGGADCMQLSTWSLQREHNVLHSIIAASHFLRSDFNSEKRIIIISLRFSRERYKNRHGWTAWTANENMLPPRIDCII